MSTRQLSQQTNVEVVARAGSVFSAGFDDAEVGLFADNFVFHYVNPQLPQLAGDYHGFDGLRSFYAQLSAGSDTGFHNEGHSLTPFGDELVVAYATNTVSFGGNMIDVDAIVVWRVVDGLITEAWDIPAVNTVRPHG